MASSVPTQETQITNEENQPLREQRHFLLNFRTGRNEQQNRLAKVSKILLKLVLESSGLWKPSKCNFIVCIIMVLICLFQLVYDLYTVIVCPAFDCRFVQNATEAKNVHKSDRTTENTAYSLGSLAAATSYICLAVSLLMLSSRNRKALEPCQAIEDLSGTHHAILCTSIVFCFLFFASSVAMFYTTVCLTQPRGKFFYILSTGVGCQFIAQWTSVVGIHVFAVSSLALGTLAGDTTRRLREILNNQRPSEQTGEYGTFYNGNRGNHRIRQNTLDENSTGETTVICHAVVTSSPDLDNILAVDTTNTGNANVANTSGASSTNVVITSDTDDIHAVDTINTGSANVANTSGASSTNVVITSDTDDIHAVDTTNTGSTNVANTSGTSSTNVVITSDTDDIHAVDTTNTGSTNVANTSGTSSTNVVITSDTNNINAVDIIGADDTNNIGNNDKYDADAISTVGADNNGINIINTGAVASVVASDDNITNAVGIRNSDDTIPGSVDISDSSRQESFFRSTELDEMIQLHEDLSEIVHHTVLAYSVWFVLHWIFYGLTDIVALIFLSEEITNRSNYKVPDVSFVFYSLLIVTDVYLFVMPCCCAAYITNTCGGIHEEINRTTSRNWPADHPFKDRRHMAIFLAYIKERQCTFKIGRITFTSGLAWFSLFLGAVALLFHFFHA